MRPTSLVRGPEVPCSDHSIPFGGWPELGVMNAAARVGGGPGFAAALTETRVRGTASRMVRPTSETAGDTADTSWVAARAERFGLTFETAAARLRGVDLAEIARAVGTPTYVYDAVGIRQRLAELRSALGRGRDKVPDPLVCYAVKANSS